MTRSRSLLLLVVALVACAGCGSEPAATCSAEVRTGPFEVNLCAQGRLASRSEVGVTPEQQGVIRMLVEEGRRVAAGDVVVALDDQQQRHEVSRRRAELGVARARLASLRKSVAADIAGAEREVGGAERDLEASRIALAALGALPEPDQVDAARLNTEMWARLVKVYDEELALMQRLTSGGAVSLLAAQEARYQAAQARLRLRAARAELGKVLAGAPPEAHGAARLEVQLAQVSLASGRTLLASAERVADARVRASGQGVRQRGEDVRAAEEVLARCSLPSPVAGTVLGAPGRYVPWEPGTFAFPGYTVARVVDLANLQAVVHVPEADAAKVERGQRARIVLLGTGGSATTGEVSGVAPLAEDAFAHLEAATRDRVGRAGRRVVAVSIDLAPGAFPRAMPGLRVRAEIVVERVEAATLVPLEAVSIGRRGSGWVLVRALGETPRRVDVEVLGVSHGLVALRDPLRGVQVLTPATASPLEVSDGPG